MWRDTLACDRFMAMGQRIVDAFICSTPHDLDAAAHCAVCEQDNDCLLVLTAIPLQVWPLNLGTRNSGSIAVLKKAVAAMKANSTTALGTNDVINPATVAAATPDIWVPGSSDLDGSSSNSTATGMQGDMQARLMVTLRVPRAMMELSEAPVVNSTDCTNITQDASYAIVLGNSSMATNCRWVP